MKALAKTFLLIAAMLGGVVAARADDILYYECGEADPGAANGVTATNSVDSAGINNLILFGGPFDVGPGPVYSSDHAACDTNSSLSLQFNGVNFGLASAVQVQTNFTAEVWVKPESDSTYGTIVYDGDGVDDYDGWGFLQEGNTFAAHLGGQFDLGSAPLVTNVWTHLELVCTNGVAMFLVNGQTNAVYGAVPYPSTDYFDVGAFSDGSSGFVGLIDDVRVSVPLPLTLTASWSPGQVALYWPATYTNYCVQYVTNLDSTNWTSVSEETALIQGELTLTNVTMDAARFYRLAPAGPPVPIVYVEPQGFPPDFITFHDATPASDLNGYTAICSYVPSPEGTFVCSIPFALEASVANAFDASASIDPRSPGNSSLSFQWSIIGSKAYGSFPWSDVLSDINFDSPVLIIPPNSMSTQPVIFGDPDSPFFLVSLTIQHQPYDPNAVPPEQTIVWFRFMYLQSDYDGPY
jgi:hypothetical protein